MEKYFQCNLSQGSTKTQVYIEEKGVILGAKVELKGQPGLWLVEQIPNIGIDENKLKENQIANRNAHPSLMK